MQWVAAQRSTGNPGSVYANCEIALAVRARDAAKRRSQELLYCVTIVGSFPVRARFRSRVKAGLR